MEEIVFNASPSNGYEYKFITYVAAILSENSRVHDFHIHPSLFGNIYNGKFNDLIVKIWYKNESDPYIYLCELKHRNRKINFGDINHNIRQYKQSIEEIISSKSDNEWLQDVPNDNIYFCLFSQTFVTGDILDNTDLISILHAICESRSFLGSKNCYKFKPQHQNIFDERFYFYLNQPNNFEIEGEIEKNCGSDFTKRMTLDIIQFVENYIFRCRPSYLTKKVFNTEILKIYFYDLMLRPTMMVNIHPKYAQLWNKLTMSHSITLVKNARSVEYNIFGCFLQHINEIFDCVFKWNSCIKKDGKLDEKFDLSQKFIDYCKKHKEKQLCYLVPQTIELLLIELWKYDELPLILKAIPNSNILHKYKYLGKRFIILGGTKEEYDQLRALYHNNIFIHVGSICSEHLINELLNEITVSFQGRKPTSLYNILHGNLNSLEELTCFRILQLLKERKPCIREKYLKRTKQVIYILISDNNIQNKQNMNPIKNSGGVIMIHCKATEVENYTNKIKLNYKFRNYSICCLKDRSGKLEILSGDYVQLKDFLIDQDGNYIYDSGRGLVPVIGKRLLKNERSYITRTLSRPILKRTILFFDKGIRVFFLCGNIQSLSWSMKQEIIVCEKSQISKDLKTGNYTLIDVNDVPSFETYWKKYSSKGYQVFYVKANNGHLEILRSENCNDLNNYLTYEQKYFEENEFFEEVTEDVATITGESGYGNTSFLRSLTHLCNEENYVLLCDLMEYKHDIDKGNKKLFENPLHFIFDKQESFASRKFLEAIFDHHKDSKKLTIFVDSFEKISASKKALSLISAIVKLNLRTVIITTPKSENQLRDAIKILPMHLNPLPESTLLNSNTMLLDEEHIYLQYVKNLLTTDDASLFRKAKKILELFNFMSSKQSSALNIDESTGVRSISALPEFRKSSQKPNFSKTNPKSVSIGGAINTVEHDLHYVNMQQSYSLGITTLALKRKSVTFKSTEAELFEDLFKATIDTKKFLDDQEQLANYNIDPLNQNRNSITLDTTAADVNNDKLAFESSDRSESWSSENNTDSSITESSSYSDLEIYYESESDGLSTNLETNNSFIQAIKNGDDKKINSFIGKGIHVNELYGIYSPLHYACMYDQNAVIECLLKHKADVHFRDICGRTPLHVAAACSTKPNIIQMLLENGSSLALKDYFNYSVMHYACYNQNSRMMSLLIDLSSSLNHKTTEGLTLLHVACQQRNLELIKKLLQRQSNVNELDYFNRIPLHYCNINDNKNIYLTRNITSVNRNELSANVTQYLLNYGANVLQQDKSGNTSLHYACKEGQEKVVCVLVGSNKELVGIRNKKGKTPFHIACQKNHYNVVHYFLSIVSHDHLKETINSIDSYLRTPLHLASKNGHIEIVLLLLSMQADPLCKDILGNTALHLACAWGFIHIVKKILENQIDIDHYNNNSETAVHLASKNGHDDVVDILIEHKCNLQCIDNFGNTAMHLAARKGHLNIIKILLKYDMNVNEKNKVLVTPLHLACKMGQDHIVQSLIFAKADVSSKDQWGNTPLHNAAQKGHRDVVKLLLKNGAFVNDANSNLETALHLVSRTNYNYIIEILLSANANFNGQDAFGNTPLHLAATRGRLYNVQKLLQFGANLNYKNNAGKTALNLATDKGHSHIINLLQNNVIQMQT